METEARYAVHLTMAECEFLLEDLRAEIGSAHTGEFDCEHVEECPIEHFPNLTAEERDVILQQQVIAQKLYLVVEVWKGA